MLAAAGAKRLMWTDVVYNRVPVIPGDACGTDYFWEVQKRGVVACAASEDFNLAAGRPHLVSIDCEGSAVDEASISNVDELVVK